MLQSIKSILVNWQFWLRLALAFLIPYLLFGSLMKASETGINDALEQTPDKPRVALSGQEHVPPDLLAIFEEETTIVTIQENNDILLFIEEDSVDIGLAFPSGYYVDSSFKGVIEVYYNSSQNTRNTGYVLDILNDYEDQIVASRVKTLGMEEEVIDPIRMTKTNTFSPFLLVGKIMERIKGIVSNILNFLFILFVIWLTRNLVLRAEFLAPASFGSNLVVIWLATMLTMGMVYLGFDSGLNVDLEGMVKGLIKGVKDLLIWNRLSSVLLLWWPTWLFIIGLLGCIASSSKQAVGAYSRTFWMVVILHFVAIIGLIPIEEMSWMRASLPVLNVFGVGQLAMKGTLDSAVWIQALVITSLWAVLVNVIWFQIKKSKKG